MKKINRTKWFLGCILFFGICGWNGVIPADPTSITQRVWGFVFGNKEKQYSLKVKALAQVATVSRKMFSVFNNVVQFFELDDVLGANPDALKELENLEVRVSQRQVPYGTSRFIPKNSSNEYTLAVKAPRGYLPTFFASLCSPRRTIAALVKIATLPLSPLAVVFDYDFSSEEQEEFVGNILTRKSQNCRIFRCP